MDIHICFFFAFSRPDCLSLFLCRRFLRFFLYCVSAAVLTVVKLLLCRRKRYIQAL